MTQAGAVRQAIQLLHEQWQRPPSLHQLASAVALSPAHLHRALSRALGEPMGQYTLRSRIAGAAYLIGDPALSITDVAWMVGYDTPAAFSAAFHQRAGLTPQMWRRQLELPLRWPRGLAAEPRLKAEPRQQIWVRQFRGEAVVAAAIRLWRPQLLIRYDMPPFTAPEHCRFDLGHWPGQLPIHGSHPLPFPAARVATFAASLALTEAERAMACALQYCRRQGWTMGLSPGALLIDHASGTARISAVRVPLAPSP